MYFKRNCVYWIAIQDHGFLFFENICIGEKACKLSSTKGFCWHNCHSISINYADSRIHHKLFRPYLRWQFSVRLFPFTSNFGFGYVLLWRPFSYQYLWPDPLELYYIIPFWHLLSNFNEMTQANKLSLNFPSLCPLVSSFINWTANVVLIFSFLQLNLKWPRLLVVYGLELLFLDISIHSMTSLLFFFLSCGDEWTRHTVSRHPRSWQWRHSLQVSVKFHLKFSKIKCNSAFFLCTLCICLGVGGPLLLCRKDDKKKFLIETF